MDEFFPGTYKPIDSVADIFAEYEVGTSYFKISMRQHEQEKFIELYKMTFDKDMKHEDMLLSFNSMIKNLEKEEMYESFQEINKKFVLKYLKTASLINLSKSLGVDNV